MAIGRTWATVLAIGRAWTAALLLVATLTAIVPPSRTVADDLPYTFYFTRYQLARSPAQEESVRYHSDGQPFAKAPDGSTVILTGQGGWDPGSARAEGGGRYVIKDATGQSTAEGAWRVTSFVSFEQTTGWWGVPGLKEEGWQGPTDSKSFPGLLTLSVHLENQGDGVLEAWCYMPDTPMPGDHQSDGISLTGGAFAFTGYQENELGNQGVMFYSTDPTRDGYVLTPDGTAVFAPRSARKLISPGDGGQAPATGLFLCQLVAGVAPGPRTPETVSSATP